MATCSLLATSCTWRLHPLSYPRGFSVTRDALRVPTMTRAVWRGVTSVASASKHEREFEPTGAEPEGEVSNLRGSDDAGGSPEWEALGVRHENSLLRIGLLSAMPALCVSMFDSNAFALEASPVSPALDSLSIEMLRRVTVVGDLDPGTAQLATSLLGPVIAIFNLLFIFRIVMSWYPGIPVNKFPFYLAFVPTEPVLGPTRRLIPPVGGVDVAPVIWVALMSFANEVLLGKQGLLVLLSQQQP